MSALRRTRLLSQADAVSQRAATRPQEVLVTFDFEAQWGMPYALFYDLDRSADAILATLGRHRASAVFFVTGKIVEEQPELVSELAARGHEVGLHGYRHEDFARLTPPARREFGQQLTEVCARVQSLVGRAPIAYRAPYLLTPAFADPDLDRMLADRKFVWTSNREIRFCEEVFRPDRVPWALARDAAEALGLFDERRVGALAALVLNVSLLRREVTLGSPVARGRWLLRGRPTYRRGDLLEVALQAPLDCDFLGLPRPDEASDGELLRFAAQRLAAAPWRAGSPCVLSFHDWIIGTSNRPGLLDEVLARFSSAGVPLLDAASWRPN